MNSLYLFLFTRVASTEGFLIAAGAILLYLMSTHRERAGIFLATTVGLMLSTELLKDGLRVPRPAHALIEAVGYAFPSGHAAGALFLALAVSYLMSATKKPLRYSVYLVLGAAAFFVGISRIYLGVHTLFQVGAGYLLGAFWAFAFMAVSGRMEKKRKRS